MPNILQNQKILFLCVCIYKMVDIRYETWNKPGVLKVYENDNANKICLLLLCISDISKRLGRTNIYDLIDKEIKRK